MTDASRRMEKMQAKYPQLAHTDMRMVLINKVILSLKNLSIG